MHAEDDKAYKENYYQIIYDHKEIVRSIMSLQGAIYAIKEDIDEIANVMPFPFVFHLISIYSKWRLANLEQRCLIWTKN